MLPRFGIWAWAVVATANTTRRPRMRRRWWRCNDDMIVVEVSVISWLQSLPSFFFFVISLFHSLTQTAKHTNSLDEKKRQIYFCCLFVCVCVQEPKKGTHSRARTLSLSPLSDAHKLLAIEQNLTDWRENPRAEEKGRERDRGWDRSITNNRGTTHAPASWSLSTLCRPCRR